MSAFLARKSAHPRASVRCTSKKAAAPAAAHVRRRSGARHAPGTEAVPNIAAFAKACEIRMAHFDEDYAHVQELADYLKQQVSAELPDAAINGEGDIPHVVNLSMPGCKSEVMLHVLEGDEVYISSGSACSKGKQSGVLKALGLPKARTDSALRVSFAPFNTKEDVDAFIAAVKRRAQKMFRR